MWQEILMKYILKIFNARFLRVSVITITLLALTFILKSIIDIKPIPQTLIPDASDIRRVRVLDRNHEPLTVTYQNEWNTHDYVPLYEIPEFIQQIFIIAEDKRFFHHSGIDRLARFNAAWQNLRAMGGVRGASTITEQVIKMIHPRPRTIWSRWLEGIEAEVLERGFSKAEILEFYLNEVPYASNRRGIVQAARYYFDRDIDTLSRKEMLALAALVRAPSRFDMRRDPGNINAPVKRVALLAIKNGILNEKEAAETIKEEIRIKDTGLPVEAGHFVGFILDNPDNLNYVKKGELITTLDSSIQKTAKTILDNHMATLSDKGVKNGAVLVVDNRTREINAWVVNGTRSADVQASWIDAVTAPRQPGSTLKPFVYALALEKGWSPATIIDDSPLSEAVGNGLHVYNNYSRIHYGNLPLRQCLGNSLNIPALKTLMFTGVKSFLLCLKDIGMQSLEKQPDFYGDGLVLGNGEITLFELVQAYATLASQGLFMPLKMISDEIPETGGRVRVFSPEAASLIGNILSDSNARRLEFGSGGVLNFPVQTAVKTGTSNDYRDAWAVGYTDDYTVGVWMGNLDRAAMNKITGAKGPAIVLRSVFAELNRNKETRPLYLSPKLVQADVCRDTDLMDDGNCLTVSEWFIPGSTPDKTSTSEAPKEEIVAMIQPSPGLLLAMDPRIPDDHEAFLFSLSGVRNRSKVEWYVDNNLTAVTETGDYLWPMSRGGHTVLARVIAADDKIKSETQPVTFLVK
ncbi:MAG: transglycosylase domain-containing protein [Deltaproteobacteria bacterium]|nr:transglycosylase domain-containing protein [Deltaproteobacteria bacterium]